MLRSLSQVMIGVITGLTLGSLIKTYGHPFITSVVKVVGHSSFVAAQPLDGIAISPRSDKQVDGNLFPREEPLPGLNRLSISKAPIPKTWDDYVQKGRDLSCYFAKDFTPPASPWQDHDDLAKNGWTAKVDGSRGASANLVSAYEGLGLSIEPGINVFAPIDQDKPYTAPNGQQQPASKAFFYEVYSPKQGIIDGFDNENVKFIKPDAIEPALARWSDIIWLEWAHQCQIAGVNPRDLRYLLRENVVTPDTTFVMEQTLKRLGKPMSMWPGVEVDIETDEGLALLGAPHGYGVAFLLMNHRQAIPKRIGSVVIFETPSLFGFGSNRPHLIFKLVDI